MTTDLKSSAMRAKRLRHLREMTGLSRDMFKQRYGIARGTLQNWESARFGGLTEKGAKLVIKAFIAEGIRVTANWLLYGVGPQPQFKTLSKQPEPVSDMLSLDEQHQADLQVITRELLRFRELHPDSIDTVIPDETMMPRLQPGDFVAGNRRYQERIGETVGQICIVQTYEHGTLVRHVQLGDAFGQYHLYASNFLATQRPAIYNAHLISSAPVSWTRKLKRSHPAHPNLMTRRARMGTHTV